MIPPAELSAIRSRANILSIIGQRVQLRKDGREYVGCCPFHEEKTPSFKVDPEKNGGVYICFGCGAKGDVFRFVQMLEGLDFVKAVERVKEYTGAVTELLPRQPRAANGQTTIPRQPRTPPALAAPIAGPVTAVYPYTDEQGKTLWEVCRHEPGEDGKPKSFRQRVPQGSGYSYSVKGVRRVLYRLPKLAAASEVWICEGEKDVHTLEAQGLVATTNSGGAKSPWLPDYTAALAGKDVIIVPDNDEPGRARGELIAKELAGKAERVTLITLPEACKDVTDYIDAGNSVADLRALAEAVPAPQSTADVLPGLMKEAIDSRDPRKAIELAPLIARTEEVSQAKLITEIFNSYGKELNRNIFMQVVRSERRKAAQDERERLAKSSGLTWASGLIMQANGIPKPILANAITALQECPEWAGVLAFNEFTSSVMIQQQPPLDIPWHARQPWSDQHDRLATEWLQRNRINVNVETTGQAIQTVARHTTSHPVREYLTGLTWDGEPRIDRWVFRYLGVPQDQVRQYAAAVGRRFLISAVARIFRPGCKADCAVILEGEQGIRKSTALKVLAGEWFTDEIADFGSKDAALQMQGAWIIELSELDGLNRSDVGRIKAFMSRTTDRFRPPYGKQVVELPRQCVFAGSVNNETYLRDTTGNRRFWPLRCGEITIAELRRDRDQLWAEAVHYFNAGDSWWLEDPKLIAQAQSEQDARCQRDPWEDVIAKWLDDRLVGGKVTVAAVLEQAIGKDQSIWTHIDHIRVGKCLTSIGLERKRENGGARRWFYALPINGNGTDSGFNGTGEN